MSYLRSVIAATICLTIAALFGSAGVSNAQGVDGSWIVVDHAGDAWFANVEEIIGKTQPFDRGWAEVVSEFLSEIVFYENMHKK